MNKTKLKNLFKLVPDKKVRYFQEVPEVQKAPLPQIVDAAEGGDVGSSSTPQTASGTSSKYLQNTDFIRHQLILYLKCSLSRFTPVFAILT